MKFKPRNTADIFDKYIGGYRQYVIRDTAELKFVSRNLCDMLGYPKKELEIGYDSFVFSADKDIYYGLLSRICENKSECSAEYRLVREDGSTIFVRDTITAEMREDGSLAGHAVLTDITDIKSENDNLRFLNETVPCGMLKYTCEKNPRVTYINDQMTRILRIPKTRDGEMDYLELYKDNIYLLIPIEDRRKFAHFLERVLVSGAPVAGEMNILRCDGTRARLFGWVTKVAGDGGKEEFQSVCMDVTERYQTKMASDTERYLKALSDVYDKIFEYDFANKTVKYVSGGSDTFTRIRNLPMQMEQATEQWVEHSVHKEDRARLKEFFNSFFASRTASDDADSLQIRYRALSQDGEIRKSVGTFLRISGSVSLFCCKYLTDEQKLDELKNENLELKKNMQEFVMRFTEGVMAFKVENDNVKPLYASDNVCGFFGYSKEEWLSMAEKSCSIKEFIAQSSIAYEDVEMLFATGEAEFSYFDMTQGRERLIKAICSQRNPDGKSPFYVMLYNLDGITDQPSEAESGIYIRTFGYFDVFINDKPIAFRNKKAKELLALLVDRRGGYVTSEEAIGYLWENEPVNAVTLARYRKEALRLKNTLEEYGIGNVMESVDGKRRIIPERLRCDLYDYLSGREKYAGLFKGSYLTNYAWGEMTLGELTSYNLN